MKKCITVLLACLCLGQTAPSGLVWTTDLPGALARSGAEKKMVIIYFTGTDWCDWCVELHREVFARPEFAEYAQKALVAVEVDFPHDKPQSEELKQANLALKKRYGIDGYPTVVVLNSEGVEIGRLGYLMGGPKAFIAELERLRALSLGDDHHH